METFIINLEEFNKVSSLKELGRGEVMTKIVVLMLFILLFIAGCATRGGGGYYPDSYSHEYSAAPGISLTGKNAQ